MQKFISINYMDNTIIKFIVVNLIILVLFVYIAFKLRNWRLTSNGKQPQSFINFINNGQELNYESIILGLIFGIIFGIIDNLGLWIGLDKMKKYLPGDIKTKAALSNTYSNILGAIIGVSITIIIESIIDFDRIHDPLWIHPIGITIGCLLGIIFGELLFK